MPYTGQIALKVPGRWVTYAARLVDPKPKWYAVWDLMADSPKPKLMVKIEYLKNHNTPPNKLVAANGGKKPAKSWQTSLLVSPDRASANGFEIDLSSVPPKPGGKGWAKKLALEEVYPG